jgi:hypothetical protein
MPITTKRLERELLDRGLLPANCRLVEISVTPASALVIRYEVYVEADQLGRYADALKAAAVAQLDDDERNRVARMNDASGPSH